MGCDIHLFVEKKGPLGDWQLVDRLVTHDAGTEYAHIDIEGRGFYDGRNYRLFSILADVRNGRGFAGVKTGEGFVPLAAPRGVPTDASAGYLKMVEQWDGDGHSHSYHTLRDLLEYDWTQTTQLQGWCSLESWVGWMGWRRARGMGPEEYAGGVGGPNVRHIEAEEMDALCKQLWKVEHSDRKAFLETHQSTYALAKWETAYHDAAAEFWSETIPRLLGVAGSLSAVDDVRIVFFFDN
jgi:hypothetical protein